MTYLYVSEHLTIKLTYQLAKCYIALTVFFKWLYFSNHWLLATKWLHQK